MSEERLDLEVEYQHWKKVDTYLFWFMYAVIFGGFLLMNFLPLHTAKAIVFYYIGVVLLLIVMWSIVSTKRMNLVNKCIEADLEEIKRLIKNGGLK